MLYLFLVDSALEIIPKSIKTHQSIGKNIKRYGDGGRLLDMSLHHSAMRTLKNHASRGRPDIVHHFLVDALASPCNKWNMLRIFIHTRNDEYQNKMLEINPFMRPPKSYHRFKGVFYNLLKENVIKIPLTDKIARGSTIHIDNFKNPNEMTKKFIQPSKFSEKLKTGRSGPPIEFLKSDHWEEYNENLVLARKVNKSLPNLIKYINPDKIFRFEKEGKLLPPDQLFKNINPKEHIIALVGGFQAGNFSEIVKNIEAEPISIFPNNLETWAVNQRIIINYENKLMNSI
ncbi:MAG: hypothetical protein GY870_03800 [archaeon]|nr:hypothetical protein [archaeon]